MTLKQAHFKKKYKQTPAMRNLNPGNIKTKGDKGQDKNKYAIYSSLEQGRNALLRQLKRSQTGNSQVYRPDFTLNQFFERYAPDGKYIQYAQQAANMINSSTWKRISPNSTPIKNIPTKAFATAIAKKEDGNCYRALKDEGFIA